MITTSAVRIGYPRFTLRRLLMVFVPVSILLAVWGYHSRKRELAIAAWHRMGSKGMDLNMGSSLGHVIYFKNGNVTDDDLVAFIPAFNNFARSGFGRIERMELRGSRVSPEAIDRFRQAVPDCEIVP